MNPEISNQQETAEQRKSNIGVRMTILYAIVYGGFVVLSLFFPSLMGIDAIFGLNLAIAYGLALIIIAIIFAIVYNALVRIPNSTSASYKNQNPIQARVRNNLTIIVFIIFVGIVLAISAYTSRKARGVGGYFVANSSINWGVNGIAFAGSYLSVASFLGICGLIAFFGFDGFLYSIGFLAGWIIALFVIAEPMKRMGTFTFSDALNRLFNHRGIHLAAGISVLVVSLFYLVPQMVGAGVLIEPLLGIPHYWGVIIVGTAIILIVAVGGMTSTTHVQLFNGGLLLVFAAILTGAVLIRGLTTINLNNEEGSADLQNYPYQEVSAEWSGNDLSSDLVGAQVIERYATIDNNTGMENLVLYQISHLIPAAPQGENGYSVQIKGRTMNFSTTGGAGSVWNIEYVEGLPHVRITDWWRLTTDGEGTHILMETQFRTVAADGGVIINGAPGETGVSLRQVVASQKSRRFIMKVQALLTPSAC